MTPWLSLWLLVGMLLAHESGRWLGRHQLARNHAPPRGIGTAEGTVFTILGLLMAFTFHGAAGRFEARRDDVTREANAISTAYQRLRLLPEPARTSLRKEFRSYIDLRLHLYANGPDNGYATQLRASTEQQARIWQQAADAAHLPGASASAPMLLLPALNTMSDIASERHASRDDHPPPVIFLMLGTLSLLGAALAGFDSAPSRHRSWFHTLAFCVAISTTAYVILDLEFPRYGVIRLDAAGKPLLELLQSLSPADRA
jgi:hypothetical protein